MKNLGLHVFYLLIIGVLGFQLWSKTKKFDNVSKLVSETLHINNEHLIYQSEDYYRKLEMVYATNSKVYENRKLEFDTVRNAFKSVHNEIRKVQTDLKKVGSVDISAIKEMFLKLPNSLATKNEKMMDKAIYYIFNSINKSGFWSDFDKMPELSLEILKSQLQNLELINLNYLLDKMGCVRVEFVNQGYKVGIIPKKAAIFEGENWEAYIFLTPFMTPKINNVILTIDSIETPIENNLAYFSRIEKTKGTKKIRVLAHIPNSFTGEKHSVISEFEYQVLPKCSVNCQ